MWKFLGQGLNPILRGGNTGSYNPLSQARDWIHASAATQATAVGFLTHGATAGTPWIVYFGVVKQNGSLWWYINFTKKKNPKNKQTNKTSAIPLLGLYPKELMGFPSGLMVKDSAVITAVAWVQSLAQELLHAEGVAKKKELKLGPHGDSYTLIFISALFAITKR